ETPVERMLNKPLSIVPLVVMPLNGSARPGPSAASDRRSSSSGPRLRGAVVCDWSVDWHTRPMANTTTSTPSTFRPDITSSPPASALDRLAEDVDRGDVDPPSRTVAAAGHEVHEPDLVDLAQIRFLDDGALGDDGGDVEPQPANLGDEEVALQPVERRAIGVIADQPRAISELHD